MLVLEPIVDADLVARIASLTGCSLMIVWFTGALLTRPHRDRAQPTIA